MRSGDETHSIWSLPVCKYGGRYCDVQSQPVRRQKRGTQGMRPDKHLKIFFVMPVQGGFMQP